MKKRFILPLIGMLAFSLTACGTTGETGPQGPQGEQGVAGQNGQDGKDGTSVLTGNGEPAASLGKDGDSYIDLDNWDYYVKENGSWVLKGNIKGQDGSNGQDGAQGDKGDTGEQGPQGEKGDAGEDGTSMLTGNGAPSSELGKDGDYYINLSNWDYYVKENGSWVLKGNIKGADEDIVYHTVAFDSNGGEQTYDSQTIKHGEKVAKPTDPTRYGYEFLNWSYQGEVWSFVGHSVTEDMTLIANWSKIKYDLSVTSSGKDKGTVTVNGDGYFMEEITVTANPTGTNFFLGWYSEDEFVSNSNPYTFTMPTNDYSLVAHFITKEEEEERAIKYGTRPILSGDEKTITYGLYPQKNVNDSTLVSALDKLTPETNGYYFYENAYYAKLSATPYYLHSGYYTFDNGTDIVSGTTYWFKCEPITWNVLSNNDGEYYILSSVLLDAHRYNESYFGIKNGHYSNNYQYSEIRSFLNNDFYNPAFALGNSHIQTTTVDNSASTTNSNPNTFACDNTQDKVFLPSYQDYINSSYGFSSTTSFYTVDRYCKPTDWARARGANCYTETETGSSFYYNGCYWTRSPYSGYYTGNYAWLVDVLGNLNYNPVESTYASVRPALSIKIA